jgi:hypothetical protein
MSYSWFTDFSKLMGIIALFSITSPTLAQIRGTNSQQFFNQGDQKIQKEIQQLQNPTPSSQTAPSLTQTQSPDESPVPPTPNSTHTAPSLPTPSLANPASPLWLILLLCLQPQHPLQSSST